MKFKMKNCKRSENFLNVIKIEKIIKFSFFNFSKILAINNISSNNSIINYSIITLSTKVKGYCKRFNILQY